MTIPTYVAVAQWALLFGCGALVILMYRQLGHLFSGRDGARAVGPRVGSPAPAFEYARIGDGSRQRFVPGEGHGALVAFVDPTCPSCEELVSAMSAGAEVGEFAGLTVLLVTFDPPVYVEVSDAFRSTRLELAAPVSEATRTSYNASATPLLVAIDCNGVVRRAGPITELEQVRAFVDAASSPSAAVADEVAPTIIAQRRSPAEEQSSSATATIDKGGTRP